MVEITSKGSVYLDRSQKDTKSIVTWNASFSGQTHFEILYKEKKSDTWSTSGKIQSTETSYDLFNLYEFTNLDFTEINFKVRVYFSTRNAIGDLTGSEDSNIFSVVFKPSSENGLIVYNDAEVHMPLLDEGESFSYSTLAVKVNGKMRRTPLVESDSVIGSNILVKVDNEKKSLAMVEDANFVDTPIGENDTFATVSQQKSYSYTYSDKGSYQYYYSYDSLYYYYQYANYYYQESHVGTGYDANYGYCDDIQRYYYYGSYITGYASMPVYAPGAPYTPYVYYAIYNTGTIEENNSILGSTYTAYYLYGYGSGGGGYMGYGSSAYRYSWSGDVTYGYGSYPVKTYYWPQKSYISSYYSYNFTYYKYASDLYKYNDSRFQRFDGYRYNYYYYNNQTSKYYYYTYHTK